MFKEGDRVVITKVGDQLWEDEFKLNEVYTIERYNIFNNELVFFEGSHRNFDISTGQLVLETIYNSPLYKIMNEVEND